MSPSFWALWRAALWQGLMFSMINESLKRCLHHEVKCLWLALRGGREGGWQLGRDHQPPFLLPGSFPSPTNICCAPTVCRSSETARTKPAQSLLPTDRKTNRTVLHLVSSALQQRGAQEDAETNTTPAWPGGKRVTGKTFCGKACRTSPPGRRQPSW